MRVKGKKSADWSEKWHHTLDFSKIGETIPFMADTRGATRKIEVYINADMHDKIVEMRAKYPHTFPSVSHYVRTILYPGDVIVRGVMEQKYGPGEASKNICSELFEPLERIMSEAATMATSVRCIKTLFEELVQKRVSKADFEVYVLDVLKFLPAKLAKAVDDEIRQDILCPENVIRIKAKYRKRTQRDKQRNNELVTDNVSNIEDYQDVSEYTAFLDSRVLGD